MVALYWLPPGRVSRSPVNFLLFEMKSQTSVIIFSTIMKDPLFAYQPNVFLVYEICNRICLNYSPMNKKTVYVDFFVLQIIYKVMKLLSTLFSWLSLKVYQR